MAHRINEVEEQTIINALRVAAEQYRKDAEIAKDSGHEPIARQFERQAQAAETLATAMEG